MLTSMLHALRSLGRLKRMIAILYLVNITAGLMIMIPFSSMVGQFAGNTLMGRSLSEGINVDFLFEFMLNNPGGMKILGTLIVVVFLLYSAIELFLSGGVLSIMIKREEWKSAIFWGNSGKYFGRFIRAWVWSLPVFVLLYCVQFIVPLVIRLFWGSDPYQYVTYWGGVVRTAIGYLGILVYYVIFDFTRFYIIRNDEYVTRNALFKSIRFVSRNIFKPFTLVLLVFLIGSGSLLLIREVSAMLSGSSVLMIIVLILIQQLYVLSKVVLKTAYYASQVGLYEEIVPPAQPIVQDLPTEVPGNEEPVPETVI